MLEACARVSGESVQAGQTNGEASTAGNSDCAGEILKVWKRICSATACILSFDLARAHAQAHALHGQTHTRAHTRMHARTHPETHTHARAHTHARMQTHTHTHTHSDIHTRARTRGEGGSLILSVALPRASSTCWMVVMAAA